MESGSVRIEIGISEVTPRFMVLVGVGPYGSTVSPTGHTFVRAVSPSGAVMWVETVAFGL
ncbi:MAG: hypothetical protein ACI9BH_000797 [Paracoccaceae bacterium]|jgi:hypothetical protein